MDDSPSSNNEHMLTLSATDWALLSEIVGDAHAFRGESDFADEDDKETADRFRDFANRHGIKFS